MNIKFLAKTGIILGSILVGAFALFLLTPFILNFVIDKYTPVIVGEINKLTGLSTGLEDVKVVTTPKLTAGLKVGKFELYTPLKEPVFIADNFQIKMSILPIFAKNIRIDTVQCQNADITLQLNKDGSLYIEKFLPKQETQADANMEQANLATNLNNNLPLKLSNHLPDIHVEKYTLTIKDSKDTYILSGEKTDITDFIFNKSIKISTTGKFTLKEREQFNFDIKLLNKIMPEIDLNELVFNQQEKNEEKNDTKFDILTPLKGLYEHNVTANAVINLKTEKDNINGNIDLSNISLLNLPPSTVKLAFKNNTINLVSNIYTAKNEISQIDGIITTGKKPYVDIKIKSDVESFNILNIVKKIALIFDIKDLQTLSATGRINADFNIKSDLKTVSSNGFLKIPSAKIYYGLYKIGIDNINADINLDNNNINIKNIGFSVLNQPLKLFGTISNEAISNLHLTANKLNLKGLLIALGQASIMKDNQVNSGTVSMDIAINGKLDKINPIIKLNINDISIKNIPADLTLKAPVTTVNITSDGKTFEGNAESNNVWLINPVAKAFAPKINANIKEKTIEISKTPVKIEKINTNISGTISDYLTEKISLNFVTDGDIKSALAGNLNISKMTMDLNYATTDLSTIIIPMFDKSNMSFKGKINISGNMVNPIVSGQVSIPSITIPEIPVVMTNMDIKLHDTILHGSGSVQSFTSGGIKAENLTSDFILKGNDFYLNNLKGKCFEGKINGNIIYNLVNAKTSVSMNGENMNAEKAIEGGAGIKKALTGTMGFDTQLNLTVLPNYNDMMKTLKGNLTFNIKNGAFGSIGRFEGLLKANNIITNVLLKNTVSAITNATGLATTGEFDTLKGKMSFSNGYANLNTITSAGKSLCYYVTGKYNLINGTTNVVILGRLDAPIVAKLGIIGELSADKILGNIPKIGNLTASILKIMTTNPNGEKISEIPSLTNGSTNYKEFKVNFNGGLESTSSVKSFKWLSNPDLSEIESKNIKETVKDIKSSFDTDIKTTVSDVNKSIQTQKQNIHDTKQNIKDSADEIKNLFKSFKQPVQTQSIKETSESLKNVQQTTAQETETQNTVTETNNTDNLSD